MRDLGARMISINTIKYDMPDVRRRMSLPSVIELAESRKRLRIHPVIVGSPDMQLIAGRDRLAADLLNGTKRVEVRLVEATPDERLDLEIDENLHRRPIDRDALIARRVNRVVLELATPQEGSVPVPELPDNLSTNPPEKKKRGRPPTVGIAREAVARELGTTPEAVRKAEERAAAAAAPPVEDFGPTDIADVQRFIDGADQALRACQGHLSSLEGLRFDPALRQRLQLAAHQLAVDVRAARPEAVCGVCGAREDVGAFCDACGSVGLQTAVQIAGSLEAARQTKMFPPPTPGGEGTSVLGVPDAPAPDEPTLLKIPFQLSKQQRKPKVKIVDENDQPIPTEPPINDDDLPF